MAFEYQGREVDLVVYDKEFNEFISSTSQSGTIMGEKIKIISPEVVVLQKMISYRHKDKADIVDIKDAVDLDMDLIKTWASNLKMVDRMVIFEEE